MEVIIPTISNPGLFAYDPENPTKYTEACSHAVHSILYALSQAGFTIKDNSGDFTLIRLSRDRDFDEISVGSSVHFIDEE